jgi:hypothetical protein
MSSASASFSMCVDNNTLQRNTSITIYQNESEIPLSFSENITCQYGCDVTNSECFTGSSFNILVFTVLSMLGLFLMFGRPDPIINIIGSLIVIVTGTFVIIYGLNFNIIVLEAQNTMSYLLGIVFIGLGIYRIVSAFARMGG